MTGGGFSRFLRFNIIVDVLKVQNKHMHIYNNLNDSTLLDAMCENVTKAIPSGLLRLISLWTSTLDSSCLTLSL